MILNTLFLSISIFALSIFSTLNNSTKKEEIPQGRQCHSATEICGGVAYEVTMCAGWFLSNDKRAKQRAIAKAESALSCNNQ